MELLVPRPLCRVVNCGEVKVDESILTEVEKSGFFKLLPDVYGQRYDFNKVTPSMINDFEFCPRLLWVQYRLGIKLMSPSSLLASVRGILLHERYQRALSQFDNVITEYKIELGDLVGVIDLAIKKGGRLIPVEVKSGVASRESHRKQLQIYVSMLKSRYGYLVYRNRVEVVHGDRAALETLDKIRKTLAEEKPPSAVCGNCRFKTICKNVY